MEGEEGTDYVNNLKKNWVNTRLQSLFLVLCFSVDAIWDFVALISDIIHNRVRDMGFVTLSWLCLCLRTFMVYNETPELCQNCGEEQEFG